MIATSLWWIYKNRSMKWIKWKVRYQKWQLLPKADIKCCNDCITMKLSNIFGWITLIIMLCLHLYMWNFEIKNNNMFRWAVIWQPFSKYWMLIMVSPIDENKFILLRKRKGQWNHVNWSDWCTQLNGIICKENLISLTFKFVNYYKKNFYNYLNNVQIRYVDLIHLYLVV